MSKKKDKEDLVASEGEVSTELAGMLAGLTFTASILIFTFRTTLPFGDVLLTLTLVTTVLFIFCATLAASATGSLREGKTDVAKDFLDLADHFGLAGFLMLLIEIALIAFYAGWQSGGLVTATIILSFTYAYWKKRIRLNV